MIIEGDHKEIAGFLAELQDRKIQKANLTIDGKEIFNAARQQENDIRSPIGAIREAILQSIYGKTVYIVQWCDHEGNLQQRRFESIQDAADEALKLRHKFDGVEIVNAETGEPVEL